MLKPQIALVTEVDDYKLDNAVIITNLDITFAAVRTKLDLTCVVFVIVLNHRQLGRYSKLVETFTRIERCKEKGKEQNKDVTPWPLFAHHLSVLAINTVGSIFITVGWYTGADVTLQQFMQDHGVPVVVAVETCRIMGWNYILVFSESGFYYVPTIAHTGEQTVFLAVSIQELTAGRCLQVISHEVRRLLRAAEGREGEESDRLCDALRLWMEAFQYTSFVIGGILLVLTTYQVLQVSTIILQPGEREKKKKKNGTISNIYYASSSFS